MDPVLNPVDDSVRDAPASIEYSPPGLRPQTKDQTHCETMIAMSHEEMRRRVHDSASHKRNLAYCNESIAYSPALDVSDDLPRSYADRAEILGHLEKYDEAMVDLERALVYPFGNIKRAKLLSLKAKYLRHIDRSQCPDAIAAARELVNELRDEPKKELSRILDKTEELLRREGEQPPRVIRVQDEIPLPEKDFEIQTNERFGRHLISKDDVEPTETLMIQNIYAMIPGQHANYLLCSLCLKVAWNAIPCEYCPCVIYCSLICRRRAWKKFHQTECPLLMSLQPSEVDPDQERLILRILATALQEKHIERNIYALMKEYREELVKDYSPANFSTEEFKSVCHLFTNEGRYPSDAETNFRNTASRISNLFAPMLVVEPRVAARDWEALVLKIARIVQVNSVMFVGNNCFCERPKKAYFPHLCENMELGIILVGNTFNLINHSCAFNAGWTIRDEKMVVFATKPIPRGSQLFISYSPNLLQPKAERQEKIQRQYFFTCDCVPCADDWFPMNDLLAKYIKLNTFVTWMTQQMEATKVIPVKYDRYLAMLPAMKQEITKIFNELPENSAEISSFHYQYFLTKMMHKLYGFEVIIPGYCCKDDCIFN